MLGIDFGSVAAFFLVSLSWRLHYKLMDCKRSLMSPVLTVCNTNLVQMTCDLNGFFKEIFFKFGKSK